MNRKGIDDGWQINEKCDNAGNAFVWGQLKELLCFFFDNRVKNCTFAPLKDVK
jgi:hypothetical protein